MTKPGGISGAGNGINGVPKKTFNMSSFFRNRHQVRALRQVLSKVFERSSSKPIRIWVPGCSDGREPYSIAMLIREKGYHLSRKIEILATDVDPKIIMLAAQGVYQQLDGRKEAGVSAEEDKNGELIARYQAKYFRPVRGDLLAVKDEVKGMVRFRVDDLLGSRVDGQFDVVSFHNVLMHLSDVDKVAVVDVLMGKIDHGGFLVTNDAIFKVFNNLSRLPVEENAYGYSAYQLKSK
ncbi:MAG: CheR family methyltransferase [Candidatus Margulisiibacteriota bacterium]|nr:CheR family methyltransferase [Candidatus Margulisiibacteriota bacterium]